MTHLYKAVKAHILAAVADAYDKAVAGSAEHAAKKPEVLKAVDEAMDAALSPLVK